MSNYMTRGQTRAALNNDFRFSPFLEQERQRKAERNAKIVKITLYSLGAVAVASVSAAAYRTDLNRRGAESGIVAGLAKPVEALTGRSCACSSEDEDATEQPSLTEKQRQELQKIINYDGPLNIL